MISVDFSKSTVCHWTEKDINQIFYFIKKNTRKSGEVEVNIIGDAEMKKLNAHYRGKNKPTDVLSFAWKEDSVIKTAYLGQIYICYPQIVRQSKELFISSDEEFVRMLAHGFLHIIGHEHIEKKEAKIMFDIQEKIVDDYFNV
jgi:probable rRNA maturation factor